MNHFVMMQTKTPNVSAKLFSYIKNICERLDWKYYSVAFLSFPLLDLSRCAAQVLKVFAGLFGKLAPILLLYRSFLLENQ